MMMKTKAKNKTAGRQNRLVGALGSASGGGAVAGAHNVCHAICVGVASALSIFGITVSSTAVMFMQDYAVYFWLMGLVFVILSLVMYALSGKISRKLAIANVGILTIGVPFAFLEPYILVFWLLGSTLLAASIMMFLEERYKILEVIR